MVRVSFPACQVSAIEKLDRLGLAFARRLRRCGFVVGPAKCPEGKNEKTRNLLFHGLTPESVMMICAERQKRRRKDRRRVVPAYRVKRFVAVVGGRLPSPRFSTPSF